MYFMMMMAHWHLKQERKWKRVRRMIHKEMCNVRINMHIERDGKNPM